MCRSPPPKTHSFTPSGRYGLFVVEIIAVNHVALGNIPVGIISVDNMAVDNGVASSTGS